jgi:regulator of protease activity HflC (stomatin/prohibitin superfamily)
MEDLDVKKVARTVILVLISLLIVISFFSSFQVIKPGNVGVVFNSITGSLRTTGQGIVFKTPFITDVQSYPVALRTYTMVKNSREGHKEGDDSIDLPTKEGQHIKQDLSVTYNTSEEHASNVFKAFKGADIESIEDSFIRRTIITAAQNTSGQMSLKGIISEERGTLQVNLEKALSSELLKMGFILDKVNLGASYLPSAIEAQMQANMVAQQEVTKAEYERQKQENLAKARIAEANGIAQANSKLQETLTPMILEKMKIEKWDGKLPQVMSGATPLINFGK